MATGAQHLFHGLEIDVRRTSGARALRVVHPGTQVIAPHKHDWPLLTVPTLGGYSEEADDELVLVEGPAAILHPPGRCHANCIHSTGMETFSIEFDPTWVGDEIDRDMLSRSHYWIGGAVSHAARALARLWEDEMVGEAELRRATGEFLAMTLRRKHARPPNWIERARQHLGANNKATAADLARVLDLHPRWLAQAYRLAAGEGLHETVRRKRVEQAVQLLRETDQPIAEIAAAAGFCDQSHLNRGLRALTGRTPVQVRNERDALRALFPAVQACSGERALSPC